MMLNYKIDKTLYLLVYSIKRLCRAAASKKSGAIEQNKNAISHFLMSSSHFKGHSRRDHIVLKKRDCNLFSFILCKFKFNIAVGHEP